MADSTDSTQSTDVFGGLRMTKQRKVVYDVLLNEPKDHPTASQVFVRAQQMMPTISLATVYNCLDTLAGAGVVKQVNVDREPSRYCGNLSPHGHFHCEQCGKTLDIDLKEGAEPSKAVKIPRGATVDRFELSVRGTCPECAKERKAAAH